MPFSRLAQISFESALGYLCKLSTTNHPDAAQYQGQDCSIVAIKKMQYGSPMLTVQFTDGTQIKGVFFGELEDDTGRPLQCRTFEFHL